MYEEGFRAHEWEILDNPSCLGEVMEMVKGGRMKSNTSGRCSPDSHRRHHFLGAFILSKAFDCTRLDPAKLLCRFLGSIPSTRGSSQITAFARGPVKGGPMAAMPRAWHQGDSHQERLKQRRPHRTCRSVPSGIVTPSSPFSETFCSHKACLLEAPPLQDTSCLCRPVPALPW